MVDVPQPNYRDLAEAKTCRKETASYLPKMVVRGLCVVSSRDLETKQLLLLFLLLLLLLLLRRRRRRRRRSHRPFLRPDMTRCSWRDVRVQLQSNLSSSAARYL